jgi:hypothetical protein
VRLAPGTSAAIAEAGQAVKPGAGQDRAGCFQAGQPGSDAPRHHGPPGEQSASQVGAGAPTNSKPQSRRAAKRAERIAAAAAWLKTCREQGQQRPVNHNSRVWDLPLELCDQPGDPCDCGRVVWTAINGEIIGRYRPGKTKGCVVCGRRLRAGYWQGYGQILAGSGPLRLVKVAERDWTERIVRDGEVSYRPGPLQRLVRKGGHQALPIPVEGGREVYTTAPDVGEPVTDLPGELLASLLAMADDNRRMRATGSKDRPGWRQAWQELTQASAPPKPKGEHIGISGADSMHRAHMWAEHFGLLVRDLGGGVVIRDVRESDPATWYLFAERVGIRKWVSHAAREVA